MRWGRLSKDHPTSALSKQPQQRGSAAFLIDLNSGTLAIADVNPRGDYFKDGNDKQRWAALYTPGSDTITEGKPLELGDPVSEGVDIGV